LAISLLSLLLKGSVKKMFLKKGVADGMLLESGLTREELAQAFECSIKELNLVLNGDMELGLELERLFYAAFGDEVMACVIDFDRSFKG
jgi:hypothetical protein